MLIDAHTHLLRRNAVVDIDPVDSLSAVGPAVTPLLLKGYRYSVGIHPWNYRRATPEALRLLRALAVSPQVVAIGECGLDANIPEHKTSESPSGTEPTREEILRDQRSLLMLHIRLSETLGKPLILHIVKAWSEIISLKKQLRPRSRWIIHGFRGKPQLARQLLDHGFTLSFGPLHNPASLALTPPALLLRETDATPQA